MPRHADFSSPPPHGAFDTVAMLATRRCATGVAIVRIIDNRAWSDDASRIGAPVSVSMFIAPDAMLSREEASRLATPEAAIAERMAFFAGVPLRTKSGENFGTLVVLDRKGREIDDAALADLKLLAELVTDSIVLRIQALKQIADARGSAPLLPNDR